MLSEITSAVEVARSQNCREALLKALRAAFGDVDNRRLVDPHVIATIRAILMESQFPSPRGFLPLIMSGGILMLGALVFVPPAHAAALELHGTPLFSDPDIVSYYRLEGNSNDAVGSNNGSDTSISYSSGNGTFGEGAGFNGSTSGIVIPDNAGLRLTTWTVSAWVKTSSIGSNPTGYEKIVYKGNSSSDEPISLYLYYGKPVLEAYKTGSYDNYALDTNTIDDGQWHHLVGVRKLGVDMELYVDGVLVGSGSDNGGTSSNTSDVTIGERTDGDSTMNGSIDDVAIFSRALSADEIADLYAGSFYAQIENTASLNLRDGTSTSANVLKMLPAAWIVKVATTTDSNGAIVNDGYRWYGVIDPTDNVTGWMAATDTTSQYISSYDGSAQAALEASSSDQIATGTASGETDDYVLNAIDHYYNNSDTSSSLYSSDDSSTSTGDGTNELSIFKDRGLPESLVWGIAALESGGIGFNNEYVHYDYGHGVMQITPVPLFYDEPVNGSGTWNYMNNASMPSNGSFIKIFPCAMYQTTTYANCYTYSGIQDPLQRNKSYKDYGYSNVSTTYKYYTNTPQSIYANVKDGMRILQTKLLNWFPTAPTSSVTSTDGHSYSPTDQEAITMTAAYYGNPNATDTCPYVGDVADRLDNITDYFANADTGMVSSTEVSQMHLAADDVVCAQLHSPGDLVIEDSSGRKAGVLDGKGVNTFPLAVYDPNGKWVEILAAASDTYTYKVVGTGNGVYGIDIDTRENGKTVLVQGRNIPITNGEIHAYSVDKNAILNNVGGGVTLDITKPGSVAMGVDTLGEMPSGSSFATHVMENTTFIPPPKSVPPPKPILHLPVITPSIPVPIVPTSTMRIDTTTIIMTTSSDLLSIESSTVSSSTNNN